MTKGDYVILLVITLGAIAAIIGAAYLLCKPCHFLHHG
jgi:hypothetical protein